MNSTTIILALALGFAGVSVTAQVSSTRTATGDRPTRAATPRLESAAPSGQHQEAETDENLGPTAPRREASAGGRPDRERAHARPEHRRARQESEADMPGPPHRFHERPDLAEGAREDGARPPGRPERRTSRGEPEFPPRPHHAGFAARSEFQPDQPERPPGPPPARLRHADSERVCPVCGRPLNGPGLAGPERGPLPRASAGREGPRGMGRPEFHPEERGWNAGPLARHDRRHPSAPRRDHFGPERGGTHDPSTRLEDGERGGRPDMPAPTHRQQEEAGEE